MQQQRARMEARRARLKKKKDDMKKYGSGGKPAVTRDTSKGVSKQVLKYGSGAKKGVTRDTSLDKKPPKAVTPKPATKKPGGTIKTSQTNTTATKSKSSGSGVTGSFRKTQPPSPTVVRKSKTGSRARVKKEDPRETGRKRNLREAQAAKARRERKEQFTKKPYGGMASSPPKNPKEGDTYKKPFGPVMIYKNGKFVRK